MRIKSFYSIAGAFLGAALAVVGCSDYDNGYTEASIAYDKQFTDLFGQIDPNHTWSTATRSALTVGVDMPGFDTYTLKVYTANPRGNVDNCYLLGEWTVNSSSSSDYIFDMPAGLETVWVTVTNQNGGRYVQEAKIVNHKCTANFTLASNAGTRATDESTVSHSEGDDGWTYFSLNNYINNSGTGFTDLFPENNVDYSNGLVTDFELVVTDASKPITLTHFYAETSATDHIYYIVYDGTDLKTAYEQGGHKLICEEVTSHVEYNVKDYWYTDNETGEEIVYYRWAQYGTGANAALLNGTILNNDKGQASRGRTITISGLKEGDHIVFYLVNGAVSETKKYKQDRIAATRSILNLPWTEGGVQNPTFAGLLVTEDATYLGFEDALFPNNDKPGSPNADYDLNDIVFIVKGGFTIEDHDDEDMPNKPKEDKMSYIIAYEDLGASYDFDFNDIVAKVTHVSGSKEASLEILAAGGTLPVELLYDGSTICGNVHEDLFGVSNETVVNATGNHKQYKSQTIPIKLENADDFSLAKIGIKVTQEDGVKTEIYAPQYYGVSLTSEGTLIEGAISDERKIPYAILIANPNWVWPDEYVSIATKYPDFNDWVKDADKIDWYGSIWGETQSGGGTTPPTTDPDEPEEEDFGDNLAKTYSEYYYSDGNVSYNGSPYNMYTAGYFIPASVLDDTKNLTITGISEEGEQHQLFVATLDWSINAKVSVGHVNKSNKTFSIEEVKTMISKGGVYIGFDHGNNDNTQVYMKQE